MLSGAPKSASVSASPAEIEPGHVATTVVDLFKLVIGEFSNSVGTATLTILRRVPRCRFPKGETLKAEHVRKLFILVYALLKGH